MRFRRSSCSSTKVPSQRSAGPSGRSFASFVFQVASRVFLQPWLGLQDQLHHVRSSKGCLAMQDYFPKRQCQTVWCGVHQLHVKLPKRLEKKTSFGSRKGVGLHDCSLVVILVATPCLPYWIPSLSLELVLPWLLGS